jgi:FMN-dependent NADH-azoreductase
MSQAFLDQLRRKKDVVVDRLDLAVENPGHITPLYAKAMYTPYGHHDQEQAEALALSDAWVDRLVAADLVLIGTPTYNFNIPSALKTFFDLTVRSGRTFVFAQTGFEGQLRHKKAVVINSRGLSYEAGDGSGNDHVTPYLTTILGFVGITDVSFVHIGPTFLGKEATQLAKVRAAQEIASIISRI